VGEKPASVDKGQAEAEEASATHSSTMKIRKLLIISPVGVVLMAALAIAWWFLGDDAWVKGKIEETVSKMTGRSLSIDGAFDLDWSSNPILTAEDIRFSNPAWAVNTDLVKLDKLEVSVDLFSLLKDQKRINYIVTNGLVVALEEHESGEMSWEVLSVQEDPADTKASVTAELPISVGRITLTGFSLLHEAPDRLVPLDFHLDQLELVQDTGQQLQFNTEGRFGGKEFELVGDLGPLNELVAGGKTSHDIRMTLGEVVLLSQGNIEQSSTLSGANIKLAFSGPKFEWILTQLALPQFSRGDFDFRLDVQTEGEQTRLVLDGDLGSLEASAKGNIDDHVVSGSANLIADVSGEDLGGLLQVLGVIGVPRNAFSLKLDVSHAAETFHLGAFTIETGGNSMSVSGQAGDWPQLLDTKLDFQVSGPDLQSWGNALSTDMLPDTDFDLIGRISRTGSEPVSTDTKLRLADSRFHLSGSLGKLPSMAGADLTITADGPVDSALTQMLGIKNIPGEDFSLRAALERDISYFYLNDFSLDLADNHLELSGKSGPWPELKGGSLVFSLHGAELGNWSPVLQIENLPASAFSLGGEITKTDTGFGLDEVRLELGSSYFVFNGTVGGLPGFAGTDLSIEAAGPSLAELHFLPGLKDAPVLPFQVKGNTGLVDAGLTFDNLNLMLGGNSLHVSGLVGLENQLEGSSIETRLIIPDFAALAPLLGVDGIPAGRLSVNGSYRRIPEGWDFQLSDGSFAGASFESTGKYTDTGGQQLVEATSHLSAPNLAKLARLAGVENLPEQPLDIQGFVRYQAGKLEVRALQGQLGDSRFEISAKVPNLSAWSGGEVDLSASDLWLAISTPSLKPVGELFDYTLPEEPLRLSATLQGSPTAFRVEQLDIGLGSSDLAGEISVDLESKPRISGIFKSRYLDLSWLQAEENSENRREETAQTSKQEYLIPDAPLAISQTDIADLDIEITVDKVDFPNQTSRDIHLHTRFTDGNLYLDPFQVRGEDGGLLSGNLTVEREVGSDINRVALFLKGEDVQLGIGSIEGQDPDTVRQATIVANLTGMGASYREVAGSMNGHIEVIQGAGLTENTGLSLIFGNLIGELLDLLNPFAKTEKFTVNECSVMVVNIESGTITLDSLVSQTDKMTIVAKGHVDLHTEEIYLTFNTKLRKGIGISASMVVNPFVSVTGTLLKPVVGLDPAAVVVKGTVAVATVGISLLARSLADRFLSSKDPCGDALKKSRKQMEAADKKGKSKK